MENERRLARAVSRKNARSLAGIPPSRDEPNEAAKDISAAGLDGIKASLNAVAEPAMEGASRAARTIVRTANGVPGRVFSMGDLISSKNRPRTSASILGSELGGGFGEALGGAFFGPPGAIGGAIAGSYMGGKAGQFFYDHRDEWAPAVGQAMVSGYGPQFDGLP